ncbi:hypothetical protein [Poritiphilus flavus]|uniref:Lipoprotein n=1 Tax=Poritiphilus flavus TaxID=2697053 RepID=A0A6L9EHL5_9FLAO|nr:hypothetical protein [Poritiphilus flavus]NAS14264.1 hypothetical protein [Poritiphilus flavus]
MKLRNWIFGCIFTMLCSCGGDPGARSSNISLEPAEEGYDIIPEDHLDAYKEVLRRKLQEDLEKIKLKEEFPEFQLSGSDLDFFKESVTKNTRLESLQILSGDTFGDTLFLKMAVGLEDKGSQLSDTVEVSIIRKRVTVQGESVFATEILYH